MLLIKTNLQISLMISFAWTTLGVTDYFIEKLESMNGSDAKPLQIGFKFHRDHSDTTISGYFNITDNPRDYDIQVIVYYSRLGNNQYRLTPVRYYRKAWCNMWNREYRNLLMRPMVNYSNFPYTNDSRVDICDLLKIGSYYVHGYLPDFRKYTYVVPAGTYKAFVYLYKKSRPEISYGHVSVVRFY